MTKFRVDVVNEDRVPCGMNSVRYLGNSERYGRKILREAEQGQSPWGKPDPGFYPILSQWDPVARDYKIIASRKPGSLT